MDNTETKAANGSEKRVDGTENASRPIDPAALEGLRRMLGARAGQLLPGMIETFVLEGKQLIGAIHQALAERDPSGLTRAAHTLKSAAGTFGASRLAGMARALEERARRGEIDGCDDLVRGIETEFEQARRELEEWNG